MKSNAMQIPNALRDELDAMIIQRGHRPWTPEMDAILIAYHGKLSVKKIAAFISKKYFLVSASTVFNRHSKLISCR